MRAGGKKSVAKTFKVKCSETHIPSTDPYSFEECLKDLLHLAAKHLKLGGRLVFFFPSAPGLDKVQCSMYFSELFLNLCSNFAEKNPEFVCCQFVKCV